MGILSETLLWSKLKGKKIKGYKFTRQKPIGNYIVDFYSSRLKLVIEIDGESHESKFEKDNVRQKYIESLGLFVMRFLDIEIKNSLESVLVIIEKYVKDFEEKQPPNPLC